MKLAIEIWEEHIDVFTHFDLVCHNGISLEDETKSNALFNALVTLEKMYKWCDSSRHEEIQQAIDYLKDSKYYSDETQSSY
jgi:hypothetical protein